MLNDQIKMMSDAELIAQVMNCNTEKAEALREYYDNNLATLANHLSYPSIKGVTEKMTNRLLAAIELGIRIEKAKKNLDRVKVTDSQTIFEIFKDDLSALDHEEFWALYMSKDGTVLTKKRISQGSVDATCADLRAITLPAIEFNACYIAVCHNHPHSSIKPSGADKETTKAIDKAVRLFDIRLIDHLIISDGRFFSFADQGLL